MGFNGNHTIAHLPNGFILKKNMFWLLSGLIEQFGIHEKLAESSMFV